MNFNKNLQNFQNYLKEQKIDFALVFSCDEFLRECSDMNKNARYLLSGFTGSAGDMLISQKNTYLFVDGRYHIQVDEQTDKNFITPIKLKMGEKRNDKILEIIEKSGIKNPKILIPSSKISQTGFENIEKLLKAFSPEFVFSDEDVVCKLFATKNAHEVYKVWKTGIKQSGKTTIDKLKGLRKYENDFLLVFSNDEICYLANIRSNQNPYSSSLTSFAFVKNDVMSLFCDLKAVSKDVISADKSVVFKDFSQFDEFIKNINTKIFYQSDKTPLYYVKKLEKAGKTVCKISQSPIAKMKSVKNKTELNYIKECYRKSDIGILNAIKYTNEEIEKKNKLACGKFMEKLLEFEKEQGVIGLSFKPILAVNERSAIIHCTSFDENRELKSGDIILLDFGVYFEGGYATDMTRTFVVGEKTDNEIMKKVYTNVLKAFLNTLFYPINGETTFFDLDKKARNTIKRAKMPDFNFNHGTGHGIGLDVHEMPPVLSPSKLSQKKLKAGMVFSIEPGMYKENVGGVRIENSVCTVKAKDGIKIETLTNLPFDEKLVILEMLTKREKLLFEKYQSKAIK